MSVATASAVLRVRLTSTISRALPRVTAASAIAHPTWPVPTMPSFIRLLHLDFRIRADPVSLFPWLCRAHSLILLCCSGRTHHPICRMRKSDEQSHLHSEVSRWRVERVQRERRRMIVRKDVPRCAVLQFLFLRNGGKSKLAWLDRLNRRSRLAGAGGFKEKVGQQPPHSRGQNTRPPDE